MTGNSACRTRVIVVAAFTLVVCAAPFRPAWAEQKPLWELGLGIGGLLLTDYRGADTAHAYPLPVPYFVYRGKFLQADRDGVRGRLFDQDRVELNISLNATAPVRKSAARSGMPDLKPTVEIGPSLELHLWRSSDARVKLDLRLPSRAAFTLDTSPQAIGWFFAPHANVDIKDVLGQPGWNLGLVVGPLFADRRYHDYFYSVAPQYATAARPAYQASGGYSGTQMLASLSKRYPGFWVGAYVRYDILSGAVFMASPLVRRDRYLSTGVAVTWMIRQSSRLVESEE